MKTLRIFEFDPEREDAGSLRGRGLPVWYLEEEEGVGPKKYHISIPCPCCNNSGVIVGEVKCLGGGEFGCCHEVRVPCDTCKGNRTCTLAEVDSKFYFMGWSRSYVDIVSVPALVLDVLQAVRASGQGK